MMEYSEGCLSDLQDVHLSEKGHVLEKNAIKSKGQGISIS